MLWALVLACTPVEPTGRPFEPVRDASTTALTSRATALDGAVDGDARVGEDAPVEGFDFASDDRPEAVTVEIDASAAPPSAQEAAAALGLAPLPPEALTPTRPAAETPPPALAASPAASGPAPSLYAFPPPPAGWGVRLVSTVPDAQPPRAILGLPDGKETVVVPGDLLPEARLVVLAIGRDAVQIAEVTPAGDHATVHTYVMSALFPAGTSAPK